MIPSFSQAIALYVAPLLALTAIVLTLFALLAPTFLLHDRVALLTVLPSTTLQPNSSEAVDGPTLFMGLLGIFKFIHFLHHSENFISFMILGSCSRVKTGASINCTSATLSPIYGENSLYNNYRIYLSVTSCRSFSTSRRRSWSAPVSACCFDRCLHRGRHYLDVLVLHNFYVHIFLASNGQQDPVYIREAPIPTYIGMDWSLRFRRW